jgi:hypothetical protein
MSQTHVAIEKPCHSALQWQFHDNIKNAKVSIVEILKNRAFLHGDSNK